MLNTQSSSVRNELSLCVFCRRHLQKNSRFCENHSFASHRLEGKVEDLDETFSVHVTNSTTIIRKMAAIRWRTTFYK